MALLPSENAALTVNFLCCLLISKILLKVSTNCKNEIEKIIAAILEHVTVDNLLVVLFTCERERLYNLEIMRRIISTFLLPPKNAALTVNFLCCLLITEILLKVSTNCKNEIEKRIAANLVPKEARRVDDDLYRTIDIYLKAHPNLDEIKREKACSVMDPLKLSYEVRVHASKMNNMDS